MSEIEFLTLAAKLRICLIFTGRQDAFHQYRNVARNKLPEEIPIVYSLMGTMMNKKDEKRTSYSRALKIQILYFSRFPKVRPSIDAYTVRHFFVDKQVYLEKSRSSPKPQDVHVDTM